MAYDPRDLFPFVKAARLGSFSAAARALQQTPSAVSKSVARLESDLGVRLFNRNTRQLQLTDIGSAFFEAMAGSISRIDAAVESAREMQRGPAGVVRVSSITSFGRHFLVPVVKGFQQRYPLVKLEIQFDDGTPDLIAEGFDVAIRRGEAKGARTVARKLASLPLILVATPEYLRARGIPKHPDDLAAHDCVSIRFPSGRYAQWKFRDTGSKASMGETFVHSPRGPLIVSEQPVDALVDAAKMGLGVVAVAASFVLPLLKDGTLKILLSQFHLERNAEVFLQYPHREFLSPRVQAFTNYLMERLREDDRLTVSREDLRQFSTASSP